MFQRRDMLFSKAAEKSPSNDRTAHTQALLTQEMTHRTCSGHSPLHGQGELRTPRFNGCFGALGQRRRPRNDSGVALNRHLDDRSERHFLRSDHPYPRRAPISSSCANTSPGRVRAASATFSRRWATDEVPQQDIG